MPRFVLRFFGLRFLTIEAEFLPEDDDDNEEEPVEKPPLGFHQPPK